MSHATTNPSLQRARRRRRIRATVHGTAERPRLSVFRSNYSLFLQLIDDANGKTLASAHTKKDIAGNNDAGDRKGKIAESYLLGKALAAKAAVLGIREIVFDRGGYRYHGRVKAAADGARDGGLVF
ncbi:MAG TPA: 50S ribosomal protein L18 [Candidatus Magasanikbacteria bacterium]|nr:MAG: 50S ribosomal protein L18 [Candidatus Magasanikbacteria bacterium RIFCSPLOWO2_02_FULL_47_16]OGH79421.1 MAG: 50S ribosomal protein L18 [Candidatus Magasanikbacteria bacterium RIFCSPHIGHO2_02_FULL_48_18]OGH81902.1 MAG: 50S ribosomal protein L18 [Candidatus Magasanikbacteria bacterium RIFCSPLOWO2_12_FULL_47_9b]HAZ28427.1 50S ribosomal protein L18 [Candidatus Magasanikbacteria bacterium]